MVFEFPASGGIVPSSSFRTIQLYQYVVADSLTTLVLTFIVIGFVAYYSLEEVYELIYFQRDYFTLFWNVIDFGIVVVSLILWEKRLCGKNSQVL